MAKKHFFKKVDIIPIIIVILLLGLLMLLPVRAENTGQDKSTALMKSRNITLSTSLIQVKVLKAEPVRKAVTLTNMGDSSLTINATSNFGNFLIADPVNFILGPGEVQDIVLEFSTGEMQPGVYTGKFFIEINGMQKTVNLILDIQTKVNLIDVKVDIPEEDRSVIGGSLIKPQISLLNIGTEKRLDVLLEYAVKDFSNKIAVQNFETRGLENDISFVRELPIPDYLEPGEYVVSIKASSSGSTATSSQIFKINDNKPKAKTDINSLAYLLLLFVIIIALLVGVLTYWRLSIYSK